MDGWTLLCQFHSSHCLFKRNLFQPKCGLQYLLYTHTIHPQFMKLFVAVNGIVLVCTPVTSFVCFFILMIVILLLLPFAIQYYIYIYIYTHKYSCALLLFHSFYLQCLQARPCHENFGSTFYVAKLGFVSSALTICFCLLREYFKKKVHCA